MKKFELRKLIREEINKAISASKNNQKFNAIDSLSPDWQDYEGYESVLEDLFEAYGINSPEEFMLELDDFSLVNDLAFDIAKRAGFKGNFDNLVMSNETFNLYCNALAAQFYLQYGQDMGLLDDANFYNKKIRYYDSMLKKYGKQLGF
jgi:hypothetical protein